MIERYTPKKIGAIWKDEEKFRRFLEIEILLCEAQEKFNQIPKGVSKVIRKKTKLSLKKIKEIEEQTHHDIVAFINQISSSLGRYSQYLHFGLTSSDLLDTTLAWQIKDATKIILSDLTLLMGEVKKKAFKFKNTLCVARTHGVHAEIYSFGLKFAYLYNDLKEEYQLLQKSLRFVCTGKISGAVGTFAYLQPRIEEYICKKIGINYSPISTQIVSRERFAYYLSLLALIGATLERFATEVRHLHRTEVEEAKEPFYKGQKGSSSMPHKQNPIVSERICGLARLLRGYMITAFENINLWHERDISLSSGERIIIPDATIVLDYMIQKMIEIVKNLRVNPQNMLKNIELNRGLIYSQKLLLKLMEKGLPRVKAYDLVQDISLKVVNQGLDFKTQIFKDRRIRKYLTTKELEEIINPYEHLKRIDKIYKRIFA
ncbi:MAG: adenylosuccinate lyase [Candidatus Omnitrophota bacterium]|nr:MAG: adenylosuccinate lyase [Candidatus Omnitrophota bacterium]